MRTINLMKAHDEAIIEEMIRDPQMVMIGEDIGEMGGVHGHLKGVYDQFGADRVISATTLENGQAALMAGAAMNGIHTVMEFMYCDFASYAFDPIANQCAKLRYITGGRWEFPVTFIAPQGGYLRCGATHSQCIEGWFQNIPGLKIYAPTFPYEYKGMLKAAIRDTDPVLFLAPKRLVLSGPCPEEDVDHVLAPGGSRIAREGKDVTIVGYQNGLLRALEAAEELAKEGIECEVIDLYSLVPYDKKGILNSLKKTGRLVVSCEAPKRGSFGNEIATFAQENAFECLKSAVRVVGAIDSPLVQGPGEIWQLPSKERVMDAVKMTLK